MHISVLISTHGDGVRRLERLIPIPQADVTFYVCHQAAGDRRLEHFDKREDIVYISSRTEGVTKSRNLLIERALGTQTDILYFCDDDVALAEDMAEKIRKGFARYGDAVLTFEVNNEWGQRRKSYPPIGSLRTKDNILSVGTVEVAVQARAVGRIRFPEALGAGAALPVGDEAVFLAQFIEAGATIRHVGSVLCSHPDESSGARTGSAFNEARGVTIRRVYGPVKGLLVLFYFMIFRRRIIFDRKELSHRSAFSSLFKGFLNSEKYFSAPK